VYFGIPGLLRKESAPLKCLASCWVGMVQNWIIYKNKNASFAYSKFVFLISQQHKNGWSVRHLPTICFLHRGADNQFAKNCLKEGCFVNKKWWNLVTIPQTTQVGVERFVSAQIRRFSGSMWIWGGYHDFSEKNWPFAANVPHFPHHFHLQDDAMENSSTEPESTDWCPGRMKPGDTCTRNGGLTTKHG